MRAFQISVTVRPEHLDDLNHVNNVQYLAWVQEVSKAHWGSLSRPEWDRDYLWVVRSHQITYLHAAVLGDVLSISTHVEEARGAQSERHVQIRLAEDNTPVVTCKTIWVLLDARTGNPVRIPSEMVDALT